MNLWVNKWLSVETWFYITWIHHEYVFDEPCVKPRIQASFSSGPVWNRISTCPRPSRLPFECSPLGLWATNRYLSGEAGKVCVFWGAVCLNRRTFWKGKESSRYGHLSMENKCFKQEWIIHLNIPFYTKVFINKMWSLLKNVFTIVSVTVHAGVYMRGLLDASLSEHQNWLNWHPRKRRSRLLGAPIDQTTYLRPLSVSSLLKNTTVLLQTNNKFA